MSSCPICYCTVEEKFMSMHIMWHDENDPQEQEPVDNYQPIDRVEYEL
jgi:hypothetical protein